MTWLSLTDLCDLLSITYGELAQWHTDGTAPHHETTPDGTVRVHRADLAAWLDHYRTTHGTNTYTQSEVEEVMRLIEKGRTPQQAHQEANLPPAVHDPDPWMSVPDVCAELAIEPEEWQHWRTQGLTPHHVIFPNGRTRIRRDDFNHWHESLPADDPETEGDTW